MGITCIRPIAPWLLTAAESSWRFSTSKTAASRLGLIRSRPASRVTAHAARSASSEFRVRRAMARVSGSCASRAVTANSSAVLSTLTRGAGRAVGLLPEAEGADGAETTVPLEGAFGGGDLGAGALGAGAVAPGAVVAGALAAGPLAAGALARDPGFALDPADALARAGGAESRTASTAVPEPSARSGDGIGSATSLREPPKHAEPASASTASSGTSERRLPDGNANGSPVEDANRIAPTHHGLKCEKTVRAAKGDSGRRDAFSCHPATAANARRTGPSPALSAAPRTVVWRPGSLQTEARKSMSARRCTGAAGSGLRRPGLQPRRLTPAHARRLLARPRTGAYDGTAIRGRVRPSLS